MIKAVDTLPHEEGVYRTTRLLSSYCTLVLLLLWTKNRFIDIALLIGATNMPEFTHLSRISFNAYSTMHIPVLVVDF
mgnify:CR=1 FL=1